MIGNQQGSGFLRTLWLLVLWAPSLPAQGVLTGTVRQDSSGRPLAGVEVLLEGSIRQTVTDGSGRYILSAVPVGDWVALFRFVGYLPVRHRVRLRDSDTLVVEVLLVRQGIQQLEPVEVAGRVPVPRGVGREAFEERRRMGFGKFVDSTVLRRSEHRQVPDMLHGIPGIRVVRYRECMTSRDCGPVEVRVASTRAVSHRSNYCWMTVMVDGVALYRSGEIRPPPDLSREFRVADLESIEIYRSTAEVPGEFGGSAGACGVIVFWTRRGR